MTAVTQFRPRPLPPQASGVDFVQPGLQSVRDEFGTVRGYLASFPPQTLPTNDGRPGAAPLVRPVGAPSSGTPLGEGGGDGNRFPTLDQTI